ncbi:MAG: alpha/beta hydrolase [Firmicutes bacterium]|nr:alpha/beta hydrolase [Bacillota bacterium]
MASDDLTMDAEALRAAWRENDARRDAGLEIPEDVDCAFDIPYGEEALQVLDVYRPRDREGEILPVIVSVHGGGWVYGDKELYQFYCMSLAEHGFAVVNFSYRLAPENRWPAQLGDVNAVFYWVLENAQDFGMDIRNIFAVGDSAGAHLLALYCAACTNGEYAGVYPFQPPEGFAPKAIALNCGVYTVDGQPERMTDLLGCEPTSEDYALLSPYRWITGSFPPSFVMTCTGDFLLRQPEVLLPALEEAGVPFEFHFYSDPGGELGHVFHVNMKLDIAHRCNWEECTFFERQQD